MKVSELIALLQTLPQDHEVILSKDGEGNSFSPCSSYGLFQYTPETTWSGEIIDEEEAADEGVEFKENAVVLWPVN